MSPGPPVTQAADAGMNGAAYTERLPVTTQRDAYTIVASRSHPSPTPRPSTRADGVQEHGLRETEYGQRPEDPPGGRRCR